MRDKELTIQKKEEMLIRRSNYRNGMTLFQYISHKTGRKPCQCSCPDCKSQCHIPCLGTPQDILKLIEAGYGDRLAIVDWSAGMVMGVTNHSIFMAQADVVDGWCTFFDTATGLCSLHDKGLKPTEGRLSSHRIQFDNFVAKKSIAWNVAKEWEDPRNKVVIIKIAEYLVSRGEDADKLLPELKNAIKELTI